MCRIAQIEAILRVIGADAADPEQVRRAEASVAGLRAQLADLQTGEASLTQQVAACLCPLSPLGWYPSHKLASIFASAGILEYISTLHGSTFCTGKLALQSALSSTAPLILLPRSGLHMLASRNTSGTRRSAYK